MINKRDTQQMKQKKVKTRKITKSNIKQEKERGEQKRGVWGKSLESNGGGRKKKNMEKNINSNDEKMTVKWKQEGQSKADATER